MIQRDYVPVRHQDALDRANADFIRRNLSDYLRQGAKLPHRNDRVSELRDLSLEDLAKEISPHHRSVNSSDFATAMGTALTSILLDNWPDKSARLDPFCRVFEVENFTPVAVNAVELPELTTPAEPEDGQVSIVYPSISITHTATAQLQSYETIFRVSRQLWQTHGAPLVNAVARQSLVFANLELRLLSELLNSNPVLSDSDTLFTSDNSAASALDLNSMDVAMDWLASGTPPCLEASGLLIAPGKEMTARTLLESAGMTLPIVVSPWLTAGSWILFSNPSEHASILRLREKGASQLPKVGFVNVPGTDSKGYYAVHDCGFSAISRNGIYRGGV